VLLIALLLVTWVERDCQEFADRSASAPAGGVTRVVILGGAGFLHVEGRDDAREVRATGRACAAIEHQLVGMRLRAERHGDEVRVVASVPKQDCRLDFTVTVPSGVTVEIGDTGGDVAIRDVVEVKVAAANADELRIANVKRNVTIDARRTKRIVVTDVGGDLAVVSKGGATIEQTRVRGKVNVGRVLRPARAG